ncbi:pyocin activator PrtN family protein [Tritonibacter mobilis]|uniref:pyocin activator PrtN family protein n=1 Tax=Tritonibacter mobilis TaxID=379347 RepID=UPI001CD9E03B|nr:pyocin activator PrtN family protein [Tritonibacter mobilis]MCA2009160.1 pyocin activator PrtN family protein [Tritonibacter mobilis]
MATLEMLIAHHRGSPIIPIEKAAEYLMYKPDTLKQKIDKGAIRIPYFSLENESQKAQKYIYTIDLANLIDLQATAAREKFKSLWEEAELL